MLFTCVGGGSHGLILEPVEELLRAKMPAVEAHRIESHSFFVITAASPSSTTTFKKNPFPTDAQFHVLFFEWKFLFQMRAGPDELAAVLLHEMGHTLNPPLSSQNASEAEHYADDYARLCCFGTALGRNLRRCLQAKMEGFEEASTQERIRRIDGNEKLKLNLIAPK